MSDDVDLFVSAEKPLLPFIPDILILILISVLVILIFISFCVLIFIVGRFRRKRRDETKPEATTSSLEPFQLPAASPSRSSLVSEDSRHSVNTFLPKTLNRGSSIEFNYDLSTSATLRSETENSVCSEESSHSRVGTFNQGYESSRSLNNVSDVEETSANDVTIRFDDTASSDIITTF